MSRPILSAAALALALAPAFAARAHIVLTVPEAEPRAYYTAALRVSHGCDGSPTRAIAVTLPAAVVTAKPQPKPGWAVEIEREPLAVPATGEGGKLIRERVKTITWRGRLDDDQFDEFGLTVQIPDGAGPLYFPTVQTCDAGQTRWTDVPAPGQAWRDVPHPAPVVQVRAAAPAREEGAMGGMHHH